MKFYVKIHKDKGAHTTAICDENLLGKTLKDKDLEIKISEDFYGGELKSEKETINSMKDSSNLNLIGEGIIKLAIKLKEIDEDSIIKIKGVPHGQIIKL